MGDEEALVQIRKGHDTMCVMLTSRYKNLDTVRSVWASGDVKVSAMALKLMSFDKLWDRLIVMRDLLLADGYIYCYTSKMYF